MILALDLRQPIADIRDRASVLPRHILMPVEDSVEILLNLIFIGIILAACPLRAAYRWSKRAARLRA
ncbi:MAG: hypothetical protein WDN46_17405 [Methylocella sp.]